MGCRDEILSYFLAELIGVYFKRESFECFKFTNPLSL